MAQVWQCDRCGLISDQGDIDTPPPGWEYRTVPVRGSGGARSSRDAAICAACDDDLYDWLRTPLPLVVPSHPRAVSS